MLALQAQSTALNQLKTTELDGRRPALKREATLKTLPVILIVGTS